MTIPENIHPNFQNMITRKGKESLLNQHGLVVWLYGLSGSGKSTLATALEQCLYDEQILTQVLDGDNIRSGLNSNLSFSDGARLRRQSVIALPRVRRIKGRRVGVVWDGHGAGAARGVIEGAAGSSFSQRARGSHNPV